MEISREVTEIAGLVSGLCRLVSPLAELVAAEHSEDTTFPSPRSFWLVPRPQDDGPDLCARFPTRPPHGTAVWNSPPAPA